MSFAHTVAGGVYRFDDLKTLLAKATPERSGDQLAGIAAQTAQERDGGAPGAGRPAAWRRFSTSRSCPTRTTKSRA